METSLKIIQELIEGLKQYTQEYSKEPEDLKEFVLWLNSSLFEKPHSLEIDSGEDQLDMELTFLLIMQNKHYKTYAKKFLNNSEITSTDGFSFLLHLNLVPSYRKMELIKIHLLEPPSGIEVIKRLLKRGLIEEFDDPDDKRARRIQITEKGKKEISKLTPLMQQVFSKMTAEMTLNEKLHIISFLRKMDQFHGRKHSKLTTNASKQASNPFQTQCPGGPLSPSSLSVPE